MTCHLFRRPDGQGLSRSRCGNEDRCAAAWKPRRSVAGSAVQEITRKPDHSLEVRMPTITTADGTGIFYKDWGAGQPIVFSHGWPLSSDDWDTQLMFFLLHGYRVVAHDRRGHGRSAQVPDG